MLNVLFFLFFRVYTLALVYSGCVGAVGRTGKGQTEICRKECRDKFKN